MEKEVKSWPHLQCLFVVCGAVVLGGDLAGAAPQGRTTKILDGSLDQCAAAITNAFETSGYHGMLLIQPDVQWDATARIWSRIPATNEWSLFPGELPVTLIRKGNRMLPYDAHFEITASPKGTNRCRVSVLTIAASVPGGREPNIHGGGWVVSAKEIPPVLEEETNVLSRIEEQLISMQKGDPRPLPSTPDRWEELHPGGSATTNVFIVPYSPEPSNTDLAQHTNVNRRAEGRTRMVRRLVDRIATEVNLDADQKVKVTAVFENLAKQRRQILSDNILQREELRNKINILVDESNKQLKVILTPQQFEKWQHLSEQIWGPAEDD